MDPALDVAAARAKLLPEVLDFEQGDVERCARRLIKHFESRRHEAVPGDVIEPTDMQKAAFVLLQRPIPSRLVVQTAPVAGTKRSAAFDEDTKEDDGDIVMMPDAARQVGRPPKLYRHPDEAKKVGLQLITQFFQPPPKIGRPRPTRYVMGAWL